MFPESHVDEKQKLILGNGASELIDLVIRSSPSGPWRPGPSLVQYMEYERSATSHGRQILKIPTDSFAPSKPASVYSLVNPTNPTGDYMSIDKLKQWICDNVSHGATVTVDESMQLWVGPNWRSDSLLSQSKWISEMWTSRQIAIYVIHSWTKIWACTGIRLGSIWCPSIKHCVEMKRIQVPWSVNTPALAFLDAVVRDEAYLKQTWEVTPQWNKYAISCLNSLAHSKGFEWTLHGFDRLSWIWIDMKSVNCAEKAVLLAKEAGVPVRSGKPGYEKPEFVRIAVRERLLTDILIKAWEKL